MKTTLLLIVIFYFQQISFAQTSYQSPVRPGNEPIEKLQWKQYSDSMVIKNPNMIPNNIAMVFKIFKEQ
jgi:hypothetical protein